jgi:ABC-type lipoprotein export system ATPase subunit
MSGSGAILTVTDLHKSYASGAERRRVLGGLCLEACESEIVGILGASGCGKSTLLNIVGGLDRCDSGTVRLGEIELTGLGEAGLAEYRRHRVGLVFQDHHLVDQCTVLENVLLPALAARRVAAARGTALDLLHRVGLGERANDLPHRLSGGERQRVALVRALVNEPRLLLCDEPTGNLDSETGGRMMSLVSELVAERRMTALVVTHNTDLCVNFSRSLRLEAGRLAEAAI